MSVNAGEWRFVGLVPYTRRCQKCGRSGIVRQGADLGAERASAYYERTRSESTEGTVRCGDLRCIPGAPVGTAVATPSRAPTTLPPESVEPDAASEPVSEPVVPRNALIRAAVANARRVADHAMSLAMLVEEQPDIWGPRLITVLSRLDQATASALLVTRTELNVRAIERRATVRPLPVRCPHRGECLRADLGCNPECDRKDHRCAGLCGGGE